MRHDGHHRQQCGPGHPDAIPHAVADAHAVTHADAGAEHARADRDTRADPTASPSPTPAMCVVPDLVFSGKNALTITQAQAAWSGAGFRPENFSAVRPPSNDYNVASQSVAEGVSRPCLTTSITVDN